MKYLKCIVCEKELLDQDEYYGNTNKFCFGYSSRHDLMEFRLTLCDICFVKKVANGTIKNVKSHMIIPRRYGLTKKKAKEWLKELEKTHPEDFRKEKLGKLLEK